MCFTIFIFVVGVYIIALIQAHAFKIELQAFGEQQRKELLEDAEMRK